MNKVTRPSYLKGTQRITAVGSGYWLMGDFFNHCYPVYFCWGALPKPRTILSL